MPLTRTGSIALAAVAAASLLGVATRPAHACSCIGMGAAATFRAADAVFVGRGGAEKVIAKGKTAERSVNVLHVLKGKVGKTFRYRYMHMGGGDCIRRLRKGEVALLFVRKKTLSTCAGNYALSVQIKSTHTYLEQAGARQAKPAPVLFALSKARTIIGFARKGAKVLLRYAPWKGKQLSGQGLRARVRGPKLWRHVDLHVALSHGPLTLVSGLAPNSMVFFWALVHRRASGKSAGSRGLRSQYELLALHELRGCRKTVACLKHGRCRADRKLGRCR